MLTFASQLAAAGDDRLDITWPALRAVGAGFWLTDSEAVRWAFARPEASLIAVSPCSRAGGHQHQKCSPPANVMP